MNIMAKRQGHNATFLIADIARERDVFGSIVIKHVARTSVPRSIPTVYAVRVVLWKHEDDLAQQWKVGG
jgi:hypothetical protein